MGTAGLQAATIGASATRPTRPQPPSPSTISSPSRAARSRSRPLAARQRRTQHRVSAVPNRIKNTAAHADDDPLAPLARQPRDPYPDAHTSNIARNAELARSALGAARTGALPQRARRVWMIGAVIAEPAPSDRTLGPWSPPALPRGRRRRLDLPTTCAQPSEATGAIVKRRARRGQAADAADRRSALEHRYSVRGVNSGPRLRRDAPGPTPKQSQPRKQDPTANRTPRRTTVRSRT